MSKPLTTACHRDLTPFPLTAALDALAGRQGGVAIFTMSIGQWDGLLSAAYSQGCILLELDADEVPVRAYRKHDQG